MTQEQLDKSMSWTIGSLKKAPVKKNDSGPPAKSDMMKRIVVGFYALAIFVATAYVNPVVSALPLYLTAWSIATEGYEIKKKDFEER